MWFRGLLVAGCLLSAACVRVDEPRDAWRRNTYITTRDRDGVRVHVRSVKDERFTVQYRDRRQTQAAWQPLPGAVEVVGTGEMMEFKDTAPEAVNRSYRVQTLLGVQPAQVRRTLR